MSRSRAKSPTRPWRRCARSIPTWTPIRSWRRSTSISRTGYDVEFFSLDVANTACIRCFRTPDRHQSSSSASGRISARQNSPDLVDGDVPLAGRDGRLSTGIGSHTSSHREFGMCPRQSMSACRCLVRETPRSGRGARSPPLSTTSVCFAPGTSNQRGGEAEGVGQAACFVDRDERIVGSVDDQGRTRRPVRPDSIGPRPVKRHARQLAGSADDEPGQELREG